MSTTTNESIPQPDVALTINGLAVNAHSGITLVEAAWQAGVPQITSVGCMEGVCGSCRVMLRRGKAVTVGLACQTFVENGIEVVFLPPASAPQHHYEISDFNDGWDLNARFHKIFPEAARCRHCHGCNIACPKGIAAEEGVALAVAGRYREAGEAFFECIMCELCDAACPELIAPAHVGLFSRRVTAHLHLRPPNLISRLEELRQDKSETALNPDNPIEPNPSLPPCRGKDRMGVEAEECCVSTPTPTLPLQGGGSVSATGLSGLKEKKDE